MKISDLVDKMNGLQEATDAIIKTAEAESRDLNDDELTNVNKNLDEFEGLKVRKEARERYESLSQAQGRASTPEQPETRSQPADSPRVTGGEYRNDDKARWGWNHIGEFGLAVRMASRNGGHVDRRLETRAPTTVGVEGTGADGGFAVPPAFRNEILSRVNDETSLLAQTDRVNTASNNLTIPKDEAPSWQSTGGIQAYWEGENDQFTQSKPALTQSTIRLNKLAVLVPVTEELMSDAPAIGSYLGRKAPEVMDFKISNAIINGTGAGQPLGILNSPALISVTKVASQDATTVVGQNIIDMYSRMPANNRRNAVWLYNQDIEPMLLTLMKGGKDDTGTAEAGWGFALAPIGQPFNTLIGRPAIATQACATLGSVGDILFADLTQYLTLQKTSGIRAETSIHLWFDYDTVAFRFIFRLGGQPWWNSTVAALNGSNTYSPYVALAVRA